MTRPRYDPLRTGPPRSAVLQAGALLACVALAVAAALLAMRAGTAPHAARTPGTSPASGHPGAGRHLSPALIGLLAGVFAVLTVIGLLAGSLQRDRRGRRLAERIASYATPWPSPAPEADGTLASAAVGWIARLLLRSGRSEKRLAERLDLAGISRKPAEWVALGAMAGLLLVLVLTMLIGSTVIAVLGGALLSWAGMRLLVSVRIARRRAAFAQQLPDVLQLIASSLKSGFSLAQGLDAVVREGAEPACAEFARASSLARLGVDLTDALQRSADRMDCTDLRWAVMAIRIQREVGGRLAEVLATIVATMRERSQLRRHVSALSAEGLLSAYILVALPVLVGGWMFISDPAYMRPLYASTIGIAMLVMAVILTGVGALWMRKVIRVEM